MVTSELPPCRGHYLCAWLAVRDQVQLWMDGHEVITASDCCPSSQDTFIFMHGAINIYGVRRRNVSVSQGHCRPPGRGDKAGVSAAVAGEADNKGAVLQPDLSMSPQLLHPTLLSLPCGTAGVTPWGGEPHNPLGPPAGLLSLWRPHLGPSPVSAPLHWLFPLPRIALPLGGAHGLLSHPIPSFMGASW